jgi:hypothetical protein
MKVGMNKTGSEQGTIADSCKHGNVISVSIKGIEFSNQLSEYQPLKNNYSRVIYRISRNIREVFIFKYRFLENRDLLIFGSLRINMKTIMRNSDSFNNICENTELYCNGFHQSIARQQLCKQPNIHRRSTIQYKCFLGGPRRNTRFLLLGNGSVNKFQQYRLCFLLGPCGVYITTACRWYKRLKLGGGQAYNRSSD